MFIVPRYLLRCGPVGLDTVRRTAQCCSRCFLIVENALASSQNALANIQNALASSQNALGSCENALVNSEDAPVNCENAIVNGETPLQNSENACRKTHSKSDRVTGALFSYLALFALFYTGYFRTLPGGQNFVQPWFPGAFQYLF